jgi:hypothetical protein
MVSVSVRVFGLAIISLPIVNTPTHRHIKAKAFQEAPRLHVVNRQPRF